MTVNKPLKGNDFANYKTIFKNGFLTQLWTTMKFTVGTVGIELVPARFQLLQVKWFFHIIICTGIQSFNFICDLTSRRQDQYLSLIHI